MESTREQLPGKFRKLFQDQNEESELDTFLSRHGFSKISLPITTTTAQTESTNSIASLRRCVSDLNNLPTNGPEYGPCLHRCISDPYNPSPASSQYEKGVNLAPQSPPPEGNKIVGSNVVVTPASKGNANVFLPSRASKLSKTVSDDSHNYETLRRIKHFVKEMKQLMDEILPDQEEENKATEEIPNLGITKGDLATDVEEVVNVERVGECLNIRFSCACGKGYQIIFSGNTCYYKLN